MPDLLASFSYPVLTSSATFTVGAYPYATGYAQLSDVTARVSAGTWDPGNDPSASPTAAMVNTWLMDATANIDAALATRGYWVPLQPLPDFLPPSGMTLLNGIGVQAWLMLRSIAAAFATHYVEAARHGSVGQANEDPNAAHWMEIYDDFVTRLESSADDLMVFGVGGPFPPDPNAANAADSGSLGPITATPWLQQGPLFSKWENLGSGWEDTSPATAPSGPPFSE